MVLILGGSGGEWLLKLEKEREILEEKQTIRKTEVQLFDFLNKTKEPTETITNCCTTMMILTRTFYGILTLILSQALLVHAE